MKALIKPCFFGSYVSPALQIAGCINPLRVPIPIEYTTTKTVGGNSKRLQHKTAVIATKAPVKITGLLLFSK